MRSDYFAVVKPGIIYGNVLTASAGFLFAAKGHIQVVVFLAVLVGTSLIIASASVLNNYIDQDIDKAMSRTSQRALVTGAISELHAIMYCALLGILGFVVLTLFVNDLTVIIGAVAFVFYVAIYGYAKRHSVHGTAVGSIPGAASIVAGYCAATDRMDATVVILFFILAIWQLPHFYAIAIYRLEDYRNAHVPVMPIVRGMHSTKIQMVVYVVLLLVAEGALSKVGDAGYAYLGISLLFTLIWLYKIVRGFATKDNALWAKDVFRFSLLVIVVLSVMIAAGSVVP